jgi:hypothetical protein
VTATYKVCPDCGKRGVTWRMRTRGEDHYGCRYCEWHAFTVGNEDAGELAKLDACNPARPT